MPTINVSDIMKGIPEHFNRETAKGINASVQCLFTGKQASNWVIKIEDQTCVVTEGKIDEPDLTITADAEVGASLFMVKTDPRRAYLFGEIKVTGDIGFGMKLIKLFS